jgi:hypothetical protein
VIALAAKRSPVGSETRDPLVAIAMARPGGHQLTDAIVSSVALVAGTRVEIVLQTSGYAPVEAKQLLARPSAPPEVWVGRGGYHGAGGAGLP